MVKSFNAWIQELEQENHLLKIEIELLYHIVKDLKKDVNKLKQGGNMK